MNAVEIRNLTKNFGEKTVLTGLNMSIPLGAIYGFIGENGSGKSTTEKIVCGLMRPTSGSIKLFDRDYTDADVRAKIGVLIEAPGCYPNLTVWNNLLIQATNLNIPNKQDAVRSVLTTVRMEGSASNKFKNCSLGMKQRIGIAMALLGKPQLLVLDEPINGLDADGTRIMREILLDITKNQNCTVLISSHILSELEKIATHYGIIRNGKLLIEMTAEELDQNCPTFVALKAQDIAKTYKILTAQYNKVILDKEKGYLRVYDADSPEQVVLYLHNNGVIVNEIMTAKIGLEEFYNNIMQKELPHYGN